MISYPQVLGLLLVIWGASLASPQAHAQAPTAGPIIPVDSPAFVYSPGNWTGDQGRQGSVYRQTWYPGAYFRVTWTSSSPTPTAAILLDISTYLPPLKAKPNITYNIDGLWTEGAPCSADHIDIVGLKGAGTHTLTVYLRDTEQNERWGSAGISGKNILRVTGLQVDAGSTAGVGTFNPRWALIVGDSITEGIYANNGKCDNLACWSYFVGQALQTQGYEYGLSACGFSGWVCAGDARHDVPPYYFISGSQDGAQGVYDDTRSRWNKIDGNNHSLLDSKGHLSANGGTGQEPSLILINYGTNDALRHSPASDMQASATQCLSALRGAAPQSAIYLIVPFSQFEVAPLQTALAAYQQLHPEDHDVHLINLGPSVATGLSSPGRYWGSIHPNIRGQAIFAAQILCMLQPQPGLPSAK